MRAQLGQEKQRRDLDDDAGAGAPAPASNAGAAAMANIARAGAAGAAGAVAGAAGDAVTPVVGVGKPAAGMGGMVTRAIDGVTFSLKGVDSKGTLAAGTAVEVVSVNGDTLRVMAYSGHSGALCDLPADHFRAEPLVAHKIGQNTSERMDDASFSDVRGPLWNKTPKAEDVNQGYLGDCYTIAAMGSVAAANPAAIMALFAPQTPNQASYNICLYKKSYDAAGNATFSPRVYVVDTHVPVYSGTSRPHYAGQLDGSLDGNDKKAEGEAKPLWPILLEKAYAMHMGIDQGAPSGDYGVIGDNGGTAATAMEAFTGKASTWDTTPAKDDDVLTQFAKFQKDGEAVVCGTLDNVSQSNIGGFTGAGAGPYSFHMKLNGEDAEFLKNTVHVTDAGGQVGEVTDDGTALSGKDLDAKKSTIAYDPGALSLTFVDGEAPKKAPKKPEDLKTSANVRGLLDGDIRLHAWHMYMFDKYDDKAKLIYFKNPWGKDHPKRGITAAEYRKYFTGATHSQVPAAGKPTPGPT